MSNLDTGAGKTLQSDQPSLPQTMKAELATEITEHTEKIAAHRCGLSVLCGSRVLS